MFELKATKGNIDLSGFNLSTLIQESNQNVRDIDSHNQEVVKRFKQLVLSYYGELCNVLDALDLPYFEVNGYNNLNAHLARGGDYEITLYSNGISESLKFGHGRGYIKISFAAPFESCRRRLSCNFTGSIQIGKGWLEHGSFITYPLESVSQVIKLGQDVIKLHILERDIKDITERRSQERTLLYYS
jgi:hypothetical protein